jgi:hypothetical protein
MKRKTSSGKKDKEQSPGLASQRRYRRNNAEGWACALGLILGKRLPEEHHWTDRNKICGVLSQLGAPSLSIMLLPTGSCCELNLARPATEEGCVELTYDGDRIAIVRPTRLEFHHVDSPLMSYFRLELAPLEPAFLGKRPADSPYSLREELVEVAPGKYERSGAWESERREDHWREVVRYLGTGTFTVFAKTSPLPKRLGGPEKLAALSRLDSPHFLDLVKETAS